MSTPAQRQLAASIGSLTRWARVNTPEERRGQLSAAREGMTQRLEKQALEETPTLSGPELAAAVERLRKAHYRRMALASARSRRQKKGVGDDTPTPTHTHTRRKR